VTDVSILFCGAFALLFIAGVLAFAAFDELPSNPETTERVPRQD
jgi:hypothetical protein